MYYLLSSRWVAMGIIYKDNELNKKIRYLVGGEVTP